MQQEEGTARRDGREGALKLLFGRICCLVGLLLGAGGFVVAILGASVNLSAGAVRIALGVLGYFLGAMRLGAASVVLVAAVFFMAAVSTGLIPGVAPLGHGYDYSPPGCVFLVIRPQRRKECPRLSTCPISRS